MGAQTIIVGDVHGCLDELRALLKKCGYAPGDTLLFVGDLVAKGPDSQGVLQFVREKGGLSVLGNHDAQVLLYRSGVPMKEPHRHVAQTLKEADWQFLEALPLWRTLPAFNAVVVHAGLKVGVPLEQQARDDVINMRSIDASGQASKRVEEGVPWASTWPGPQRVIFGHDAIRGLQQYSHALGLDTGCVYGRQLTAVVLPEDKLVSVDAKRAYQKVY
ncbi:MAG: metallophosphoesterase [Myxococcaceae bacterium]|nr:metallophosphoesterase [Myxococcaceae bacterium]